MSWFQYNSLLSAIPTRWRRTCATNSPDLLQCSTKSEYDLAISRTNFSRYVYRTLLSNEQYVPKAISVWCEKLDDPAVAEIYMESIRNIPSLTISNRLRSFQFRFLHNALVLNTHLYHWNIRSNNLCSMCNNEREDLEHLFFNCYVVRDIWKKLESFLSNILNINIDIRWNHVIWCKISDNRFSIMNCIILIVKQLIYRHRCLGLPLTFSNVKNAIYEIKSIEKYIAVKENKTSLHERKWANL